jgi:hypothetical protein
MEIKLDNQPGAEQQVQNFNDVQQALKWLGFAKGGTSSYPGKVVSAAADTPFPDGWSVASAATGKYVVTHNRGDATYVPVCTAIGTVSIPSIISIGADSFEVWFYSITGSLQATSFVFALIPQ